MWPFVGFLLLIFSVSARSIGVVPDYEVEWCRWDGDIVCFRNLGKWQCLKQDDAVSIAVGGVSCSYSQPPVSFTSWKLTMASWTPAHVSDCAKAFDRQDQLTPVPACVPSSLSSMTTKRSMAQYPDLQSSLAAVPESAVSLSKRRRRHHGSPMQAPSPGPVLQPPAEASRAPAPTSSYPVLPVTGPPPNPLSPTSPAADCHQRCSEPYTTSPHGSPCGCVIPIQLGLQLEIAPYVLFKLITDLAEELAAGTFLSQNQVRIVGANSVSDGLEKTEVKANLVPLGQAFDNTTALLIAERFWTHQVYINTTLFGTYYVLYVHYPGLPPSPPSEGSFGSAGGPNKGYGGTYEQPLGVQIRTGNSKMSGGLVAVIALSAALFAVICAGAIWMKYSFFRKTPTMVESIPASSVIKRSGGRSMLSSSVTSSTSSFASSFVTYTGSAKLFTYAELDKATNKFRSYNVIGEGGFGRVYCGVLEDQTKIAVKVLTRDDHQGSREFAAEVEMLSRLHHRNLVKLIGICTEQHSRCLVYELIPNGSVESHLHGADKETCPLDWEARLKIALGAARGLAYLHEDSSPRVIHRDFKASNILLEDDFTPKISDFGLAKAAPDEMSSHISTRVMGTFGYVAPEYAMTGHLLVKSDVYSYGVVLLELLSGRKPVDMSQPPGQENLVTWARPLLNSKEGLEVLVDPSLGNNFSFDNLARVAAIASMCVQPEVSHRPFMGEVVQALKLVYNDSDASDGLVSANQSYGGESPFTRMDLKQKTFQHAPDSFSFVSIDYDSGHLNTVNAGHARHTSSSILLSRSVKRHNSFGNPRKTGSKPAWYRRIYLKNGSKSEHEPDNQQRVDAYYSDIGL